MESYLPMDWTIVHDFDGDEGGIVNGIQDHTVIKSNVSIGIGEKLMFMLDEVGQGDFFGTNYTARIEWGFDSRRAIR